MSRASQKPRLLLLVPRFPKLSETFIVSKFLGLLNAGWDVHVACQEISRQDLDAFPELARRRWRRRVHRQWPQRPRALAALLVPLAVLACAWRNPRGTWRCLRRSGLRRCYLEAHVIARRPALIHIELGGLAPERMHLRAPLAARMLVSFRGSDLAYVGLEDPEHYRRVWQEADGLHLLSQALWRRAGERGCPQTKRYQLIPPAIADVFEPDVPRETEVAGTRARPLRLLSVGRLEWVKGYEHALAALRVARARGLAFEYRVIGDGEHLEAVAFCRHQLGLSSQVELMGARSPEEVRQQMRWADVFLHPAVSEGFCNAVLEAQAMAIPVVASDAGGLPENVVDGQTGFVVPRRRPEPMAERLLELARDPLLRRRLGDAGRQRVLASFRLEDQIAAFDRLYRDLLGDEE